MKRFVKEYANFQLANNPFCTEACKQFYIYRITTAVEMCEKGYLTVNDAMGMILNAEQYAMQEAKA